MDDLVRGLQAGDGRAFERLVREHGDRLYRFLKRLVGERWAEDLTQEALERVHRSIGSYRPEGRFEAWLFTIANNLAIDFVRRRKPEASMSELGAREPEFEARAAGPVEAAERHELKQALLRAVERLPVEQKQVFLLREEGGLSFREIAETVGCPLNTALGRMHYAMESLRRSLKAHGLH